MKGIEFTDMDIEKLIVIQSVIDGKKTGKQASEKLNLSERQIWRLVAKVKNNGNKGIKHGNCFNRNPRFITEDFKNKIKDLKLSDDYCDANFTHFQELLEECENIKISYSSLYKILTEKGIKSKKKHKDKKTHRQRKRKDHMGELVQADGTPFDWFKDGHMYSIHGFIDDATGQVLGAYMCEHECLLGYLEVLRQMLTNYGIPQCLYPDKFSVEPKSDKSYFVQVPSYLNLDLLLSIKLTRCIDASGSFTIKNKKFQILDNKIMPKTKVNIYMSQKIGIIAEHNNTKYKVICSDNLPNTYKNKTADKFLKSTHKNFLVLHYHY